MKIKTGSKYKVRILETMNLFYPQIYIKSFWNTGWYYIDKDAPTRFVCSLTPNVTKTWNANIELAEKIISEFKDNYKLQTVKIHNEREEQF